MASFESLIPELEEAVWRGSAAQRAIAVSRIADLFLADASRYGPEHIALFDDVLCRLVVEIETEARAQLSRVLAPVPNAPTGVVVRLANDDDIAVAGPVLAQSPRLDDAALVGIAKTHSQAHLLAIAGRPEIAAQITDVLVGRGDGEVVRHVVDNPGARFSEAGFTSLAKRAEIDGVLAEKVRQRPDIPPRLFRKLVLQATEVVQQRLLANARPEARAEIKRVLTKVADEIRHSDAPARDYSAAQRKVLALRAGGKLDEAQLVAFAQAGEYSEMIAALSALCAVPIETVDRLLGGDRPDPVLILCRALGFGWQTARAVMQARAGQHPISRQALDNALGNFQRLSLATAHRVVRFWQARKEVLPPTG